MDTVIVLSDSDDEDASKQMRTVNNNKRKIEEPSAPSSKKIRRITPIKIGEATRSNGSSALNASQELLVPLDDSQSASKSGAASGKKIDVKAIINPAFQGLLDACRKAEKSEDMEKLIDKKLVKYYTTVHPDFLNSKSFCKSVKSVTEEILKHPELVYLKIKNIVEELNARRKSKVAVVTNEDVLVNGTGNEKADLRIEKLNKALSILNRKILRYDDEEVDFVENDEAHSAYLISDKCKKRACEIYHKLCDMTGESKYAERIVKKPISFKGTSYPEFNKTIEKLVNKSNAFPDFRDVLKCFDFCNKKHNFKLKPDELKKIASDAFQKLGEALQKRRKTDFYETVTYFLGGEEDPALKDNLLKAKLEENKKHYSKINDVIHKFAIKQDEPAEDNSDSQEPVSSTSKVEKLNKEIIRKIEPIITLESVSQISNPTLIEESEVILDDVPPLVKDEIDPEMEQVLDHVIEEDIFCSNIMENCENLFLDAEDDHLIELS